MATGYSVLDALNRNSRAGAEDRPRGRFRTKDISIHKMYRNGMNFYSVEDIESLASAIQMNGLKQNLELVYAPCEKGEYRIIAGERRWEALKLLVERGEKDFEIVTCKLTNPQDDDEEQVEIIIANAYRDKTIIESLEEAKRLKSALERMRTAGKKIKGYDLSTGRLRDTIAAILNTSATKIAQIETINNNLLPELREEIRKGNMLFSTAYMISSMPEEDQKRILEKYKAGERLTCQEAKKLKDRKKEEAQEKEGKTEAENNGAAATGKQKPMPEAPVSESDTEKELEPQPDKLLSICYSCRNWNECQEKSVAVSKCNEYISKKESEMTEEQKYEREQEKIDRETKRKLREQEDEEKLNRIGCEKKNKLHQYRISSLEYADLIEGKKTFQILKDDGYQIGDILEMLAYKDGRNTGEAYRAEIIYIHDGNVGLQEGYKALGIKKSSPEGGTV